MLTRSLIVGASFGLAVALPVTLVMTFLDWRKNPAGLFHDQNNTDWTIVAETAASWFLPVMFIVFVAAAVAHYWRFRD